MDGFTEEANIILDEAVSMARKGWGQRAEDWHATSLNLLHCLAQSAPETLSRFFPEGATRLSNVKQAVLHGTFAGNLELCSQGDPFSNTGSRILAYAREEAWHLGLPTAGPGHLILGILREEKSAAAGYYMKAERV